jgi:hypothetical protein
MGLGGFKMREGAVKFSRERMIGRECRPEERGGGVARSEKPARSFDVQGGQPSVLARQDGEGLEAQRLHVEVHPAPVRGVTVKFGQAAVVAFRLLLYVIE